MTDRRPTAGVEPFDLADRRPGETTAATRRETAAAV
jgi:hypothetical protein